MPLSEHEKRQLEELERAWHEPAGPPARRGWLTTRRLLAFSTLGMLGGLVLLLSGLGSGSGLGITLAVVGCVLVLACSLVAVPALTKARWPRWRRGGGGGGGVSIPAHRPGPARSPPLGAGLDVGDRITAAEGLGGFLRPRVPAGTPGIITARLPGGLLRVRFVTGQTISAAPGQLVHAGQP